VGIELAKRLIGEGARIKAYDPKGMEKSREAYPQIPLAADPYEAAQGADALVIATEWTDFKTLDWGRIRESLRTPLIFDGRNLLNPEEIRSLGFEYHSVGR
jgi:UDPglucose 6-dehydrogenase